MADEIGTKVSQLPLGENLGDSDLMYAVEGGISKKAEISYLKTKFTEDIDVPTALADLSDDSTHRVVTDTEKSTWSGKQDALTFDNTPTENSTNPVKSGGVYTALEGKANSSDLATVATSGSYNDLSNTPTIPSDADDISYDNTESGLTADDVQGAIDEVNGNIVDVEANPSGTATGELETIKVGSTIYNIVGGETIYGEASGAIASFSDGSANPLADLKIAINPVQAGSGDPSPQNERPISGWSSVEVTVVGKNLFDKTAIENNKWLNISTGEVEPSNGYAVTAYIKVEANKPITMGAPQSSRRWFYDLNKNPVSLITNDTYTPTQSGYIRVTLGLNNVDINAYQIEYGRSLSPYTAYNGTTETISLGQTVYGGKLNVTTGELAVDRAMVDLGTLNWSGSFPESGNNFFTASNDLGAKIPSSPSEKVNAICSIYKAVAQSTWTTNIPCFLINTTGYLIVADRSYSDTETFKTAMSGVQLVYEIATPTTISLTPTQVSSLLGSNNIWADSGDSDVVYICNLNLFLNQLDARVKALENA